MQQQIGASDCGVFAIAFACIFSEVIEEIEFDQRVMRVHLSLCFKKKTLLPFPTTNIVDIDKLNISHYESLAIYCYCKTPDTGEMVQCDGCEQWVKLGNLIGKWICKTCCNAESSNLNNSEKNVM